MDLNNSPHTCPGGPVPGENAEDAEFTKVYAYGEILTTEVLRFFEFLWTSVFFLNPVISASSAVNFRLKLVKSDMQMIKHTIVIIACLVVLAACAPAGGNPALTLPPPATSSPGGPAEGMLTALPPNSPGLPVVAPGYVPAEIHMNDLSNGWGLRGSRVLRTRDGGKHWRDISPQAANPEQELIPAYFLNVLTAWVIYPSADASQGTLYHTTDAGLNWRSAPVPFGSAVLQALDAQTLFAMADRGAAAGSQAVDVYRSTDAGVTWEEIYHVDPQGSAVNSLPFGGDKTGMAFSGLKDGWITGVEPVDGLVYLYHSQDGGGTWQLQPVDPLAQLSQAQIFPVQVQFFSPDQGVIPFQATLVQNNNPQSNLGVMVTTDGGRNWKFSTLLPSTGVFYATNFAEFFVWDGTSLYLSRDSGKTWNQTVSSQPGGASPYMIQFLDPSHGWLVDNNGAQVQLFQTRDGGKTWIMIASD